MPPGWPGIRPATTAVLPTRAGNAFAALDQRVRRRHGLDLSACWPLIEQTLCRSALDRLEAGIETGRRADPEPAVDRWPPWSGCRPSRLGLAVLVAVACAVLAVLLWWAVSGAVEQYCALIEATVAAHRRAMYVAVGWRPPTSTAQEPERGRALTGYLRPASLDTGDVDLEWPDDAGA